MAMSAGVLWLLLTVGILLLITAAVFCVVYLQRKNERNREIATVVWVTHCEERGRAAIVTVVRTRSGSVVEDCSCWRGGECSRACLPSFDSSRVQLRA
jgi:hypothetical protein